jgi:predicted RNA-binding protein YlqC (UPF0109 family)
MDPKAGPQHCFSRWYWMKELIDYIAKLLVEHPEQVEVREFGGGDRVRLELTVARDDMGRVIGKGGRVANAIRAVLRVAAEREGKQATLDVVEPE